MVGVRMGGGISLVIRLISTHVKVEVETDLDNISETFSIYFDHIGLLGSDGVFKAASTLIYLLCSPSMAE